MYCSCLLALHSMMQHRAAGNAAGTVNDTHVVLHDH